MAGALAGKVGLITGGASGIGRATALAFAAEGAHVVVADINHVGAAETAKIIEAAGGDAVGVQADVSEAGSVEALIRATLATYGRLDCAFNNAGVSERAAPTPRSRRPIGTASSRINLKGVWLCMKYEIPRMRPRRRRDRQHCLGLGLRACRRPAAYVASKHGIVGMTTVAACENAARRHPRQRHLSRRHRHPHAWPRWRRRRAPRRLLAARKSVRPPWLPRRRIAEAVVWLCSDAASFVTGHAMSVDGGFMQQ